MAYPFRARCDSPKPQKIQFIKSYYNIQLYQIKRLRFKRIFKYFHPNKCIFHISSQILSDSSNLNTGCLIINAGLYCLPCDLSSVAPVLRSSSATEGGLAKMEASSFQATRHGGACRSWERGALLKGCNTRKNGAHTESTRRRRSLWRNRVSIGPEFFLPS